MNHYFRLLFVSFVLFLMMGLNERQFENSGSSRPVAANLAQQAGHTRILSAEAWITYESYLPAVSSLQAFRYGERKEQREFTNSRVFQTRFIFYTCEFSEYRPGIAWKTGQFLHFQAAKGDPSLA